MYSKLFSSILSSSIWSEDSDTCKVWITLLAMQDREGYVFGSPAGIARIAALPLEAVGSALQKFLEPDSQSADLTREPDRDGRRIEVVPGGWRLLNAEHYRELGNQDMRREQNREAKRKQREKDADCQQESAGVSKSQQASAPVPKCHPSEASPSAPPLADAIPPLPSGERPPRKKPEPFIPPTVDEVRAYALEIGAEYADPAEFHEYWTGENWTNGRGRKLRDWRKAFRNRERELAARGPRRAPPREINPDVHVGRGESPLPDPEGAAKLREILSTRKDRGLTREQAEREWCEWDLARRAPLTAQPSA